MTGHALLLELLPAGVLFCQILVEFLAVAQVEGDGAVDLLEREGGEIGSYRLGGLAFPVGMHDGIERDPSAGNPPAAFGG